MRTYETSSVNRVTSGGASRVIVVLPAPDLPANRYARPLRIALAAVYLLTQGKENRIENVSTADATRALLGNVLFFADDPDLVQAVFHSACGLVDHVPVRRLTFVSDAHVWELIK